MTSKRYKQYALSRTFYAVIVHFSVIINIIIGIIMNIIIIQYNKNDRKIRNEDIIIIIIILLK